MPEDSTDFWGWSTFSFVEPLFKTSNARTVNDEDVWALSPFFTHKNIFTKYLSYISKCASLLRLISRDLIPQAGTRHIRSCGTCSCRARLI